MRTIRVSEVGVYLFCKRAWWYQLQGTPSQNQNELAAGTAFHQQHGRQVFQAWLLRLAGWVVLLAALVVLAIALTLAWLPS